jgi:BON domain
VASAGLAKPAFAMPCSTANLAAPHPPSLGPLKGGLRSNSQIHSRNAANPIRLKSYCLLGRVAKETLTPDSQAKLIPTRNCSRPIAELRSSGYDIEVLSSERTDADIAAVAVRALVWNSALLADRIRVTVSKGWVTLEGDVEWQYQKREAENTVRRLWGVRGGWHSALR